MARHAYMQRIYLPSVLARHRYVTKKRAALFNLAEYALRRAAAREHAIRVLYTRCMRQALQHQDHVQNLRLLCEAASEYHTERLKRKAVQHIRVQTLKNRLAQRNNKICRCCAQEPPIGFSPCALASQLRGTHRTG